jgi:glycosyltransferase involved in cell wall biosynthesis
LVIAPDQFRSMPCPTYPEIRLAFVRPKRIGAMLRDFAPDAIHLSTEGPLCIAARHYCVGHDLAFTTAYHTQFPDYVARRTGLSAEVIWPLVRRFHRRAQRVMVSTRTMAQALPARGIGPIAMWGRGVDTDVFHPTAPPPALYADLPRPVHLYVGRVAVEKNIEAFLALDTIGTKVVVGNGPQLEALQTAYPDTHFAGQQSGAALAGYYAGADVFVFPSTTDTFGLVMIEAMACGTPVAAYPVTGPVDVLTAEGGAMDADLGIAVSRALTLDRGKVAALGQGFSWDDSADQFLAALYPADGARADVADAPATQHTYA